MVAAGLSLLTAFIVELEDTVVELTFEEIETSSAGGGTRVTALICPCSTLPLGSLFVSGIAPMLGGGSGGGSGTPACGGSGGIAGMPSDGSGGGEGSGSSMLSGVALRRCCGLGVCRTGEPWCMVFTWMGDIPAGFARFMAGCSPGSRGGGNGGGGRLSRLALPDRLPMGESYFACCTPGGIGGASVGRIPPTEDGPRLTALRRVGVPAGDWAEYSG